MLNSFDDWKSLTYDLFIASGVVGGRPIALEADANALREVRLEMGQMMAPRIVIDQSGPSTAKPGDLVTYSVTVTNTGRGPAISPTLARTNPDGTVETSDLGIVTVGSESTELRSFAVPLNACPGDFTGAGASMSFKDFPGQDLTAAVTTPLEILDVAAPVFDVSLSPTILWPPNHKFVDVTATITFTDNCDPNPAVTLVSITSNEPESGFLGQGDNAPDIQGATFGTDDRTFSLRAERGTGQGRTGRVYTVTYRVTDKAGNATVKSATVTVPTSNSGQ